MESSKETSKPMQEQAREPQLSENAWKIDAVNLATLVLVVLISAAVIFKYRYGLAYGVTMGLIVFVVGLIGWASLRSHLEPKRFATEEDFKLYRKIIWQKDQDKYTELSKKQAQQYNSKRIASSKPLQCPKCGSQQLHSGNRGFKTGRAVAVGMLTFGVGGLVAGAAGKNKIIMTCLNCGYAWKAGQR